MKLIKQSFEIIPQENTLEGLYKHIEKCGRICYKSEDKITEDSAKPFVDRMIKSNHGAMLEHGTVYLFCPTEEYVDSNGDVQYYNPLEKYQNDNYSVLADSDEGMYITTNLRVLVENGWLNDFKYLCEPTEYHERRITVKFTTDQGILREFTRHRKFSFAVESTRYCNYSKDKFNKEITCIEPTWLDNDRTIQSEAYDNAYEILCSACEEAEGYYFTLLENGFTPQEARNVLPLATKCDMVMTGFVEDWSRFFALRADGVTGAPHPQAKELAIPLKEEFYKKHYLHYD